MNGARVVARAWVDPAYRARLLADGTAAIAELGFGGPEGEHLSGRGEHAGGAQRRRVHAVLLLPVAGARSAAELVQEPAVPRPHGARAARAAARDGSRPPESVEIRVWDSSAEIRYMVLPERPAGSERSSEEELAALVTRDAMIGTARP